MLAQSGTGEVTLAKLIMQNVGKKCTLKMDFNHLKNAPFIKVGSIYDFLSDELSKNSS